MTATLADAVRIALPHATGAALTPAPDGRLQAAAIRLDPRAFEGAADGFAMPTLELESALEDLECAPDGVDGPIRLDTPAELVHLDARCADHPNPLVRSTWDALVAAWTQEPAQEDITFAGAVTP